MHVHQSILKAYMYSDWQIIPATLTEIDQCAFFNYEELAITVSIPPKHNEDRKSGFHEIVKSLHFRGHYQRDSLKYMNIPFLVV